MKTTAIFVEQVLVGLLVLVVGSIPYLTLGMINSTLTNISKGIGIVAVAYLLGIIFDRFADTLLSRCDQYHRLKFTIKLKKKSQQRKDPFPEGKLRATILDKAGGTAEWIEYLWSRIRLSRALAVFLPGLMVSGILAIDPSKVSREISALVLSLVASIYAGAFILVLIRSELPKTDEPKIKEAVENFHWWSEPTTLAGASFLFLAIGLVIFLKREEPDAIFKTISVALIGSTLSALSFWTWWRINSTFKKFLITVHTLESNRS